MAIVYKATWPEEKFDILSLKELADKESADQPLSPSVLIIGEVVNLRESLEAALSVEATDLRK